MKIYLIILRSFPSKKVIANNVLEAINKYKEFVENNKMEWKERLNSISSVKHVEDFNYIS